MTKQEIIDKTNAFLIDEYEKEPTLLKPEARFREDLDLNSLDYMDLMVTVNKVFGIMPAPSEMNLVVTLGDFYDFIEKKLNEPEQTNE
ncbi:MAG: acyl carrier protein [Paludibacteraceae bacterium]|nr:acyl carrier protein [Paludibacteraceae bacterium]MBQ6983733.1 acyl carrier protein [Paludibacteraceae bacterium]